MVKQRQIADELFECVWPFCGVGIILKGYGIIFISNERAFCWD